MNSLKFQINDERCIMCGECVLDCPMKIIQMEDGNPFIKPSHESRCIKCQHCLVVCPTGAVSIFGVDPDDCVPYEMMPSEDAVDALIRNRRTVRRFKNENIPADRLEKLIKTASNAPTGENHMGLTLSIIDDMAETELFREAVISAIEKAELPAEAKFFAKVARAYRMGNDIMFRNAPHIVFVSANSGSSAPVEDGIIALTYFEIMAASMGLGTVWVNFLMQAMNLAPELKQLLKLPEGDTLVYPMLLGIPDVIYHRGVKRDSIGVKRLSFKG